MSDAAGAADLTSAVVVFLCGVCVSEVGIPLASRGLQPPTLCALLWGNVRNADLCYQALVAWAGGSGSSASVLTREMLNIYSWNPGLSTTALTPGSGATSLLCPALPPASPLPHLGIPAAPSAAPASPCAYFEPCQTQGLGPER